MNWKRTIFIVCLAYAVAGFCQAVYVFLIDPPGHGGGTFWMVMRYFLDAPVSLVSRSMEFGIDRIIVIEGTIFAIVFLVVTGTSFWWNKRQADRGHPQLNVVNWTRVILVLGVPYVVAGFCMSIYTFVIDPRGHDGSPFGLVIRDFLAAPISLASHVLRFGFHKGVIVDGIIFVTVFPAVMGILLWWTRHRVVDSASRERQ